MIIFDSNKNEWIEFDYSNPVTITFNGETYVCDNKNTIAINDCFDYNTYGNNAFPGKTVLTSTYENTDGSIIYQDKYLNNGINGITRYICKKTSTFGTLTLNHGTIVDTVVVVEEYFDLLDETNQTAIKTITTTTVFKPDGTIASEIVNS